jgi:hypothetical protein
MKKYITQYTAICYDYDWNKYTLKSYDYDDLMDEIDRNFLDVDDVIEEKIEVII